VTKPAQVEASEGSYRVSITDSILDIREGSMSYRTHITLFPIDLMREAIAAYDELKQKEAI
jgi:hypothetical protein